ncbi:MAG: thiaminase II [Dysgonomonas sp.]
MKWSERTWHAALPVYNKILKQPFIKELMEGTLDKEKFMFYIRQDAAYLSEYGKILSVIASKLDKPEHSRAFLRFAGDTMQVEEALHESFLGRKESVTAIEATPSCLLYTSYLHKQSSQPVYITLASVLPCFWIYKEVGDYILANQMKGNNPYQSWIDTYGGEDYEKSVVTAISICDKFAAQCTEEQQRKMTEAFVACSRFEWMFWDSAYRLEKWAV